MINLLLDFSYTWEFLSGMAVDTFNLYRLFLKDEDVTPFPIVWDTKGKVNIFVGPLASRWFNQYVNSLGKLDRSIWMKVGTLLQILYVLLNRNRPYVTTLTPEQKDKLFNSFLGRVFKRDEVDLNNDWYLVSPPANFYYELAKYSVMRLLDKHVGIYKREVILPKHKIDIVLYQYPRFLKFKGAVHLVKIHDLYPLYLEGAIPEGSRTAETRRFSLQKLAEEKWDFYYITPTQATAEELEAFHSYFKGRTFVVYNNLQHYDYGKLMAREKTFEWLKKRQKNVRFSRYFIQVGTIQPIKNHKYTLRAFLKLRKEFPELGLVFVGGWGWKYKDIEPIIRRLQREGLLVHVYNISQQKLFSLIKHAEGLLMPSLAEGFGLPPLEALKVGTIPIVSRLKVFREVLSDAALYVSLDNIDEYVKVLRTVLINRGPLQAKIADKGKSVLSRYSDESVQKQWKEVFRTLSHKLSNK